MQYHDADLPAPFATVKADRSLPLPEEAPLSAQSCAAATAAGGSGSLLLLLVLLLVFSRKS